jgi:hypothetical protein
MESLQNNKLFKITLFITATAFYPYIWLTPTKHTAHRCQALKIISFINSLQNIKLFIKAPVAGIIL